MDKKNFIHELQYFLEPITAPQIRKIMGNLLEKVSITECLRAKSYKFVFFYKAIVSCILLYQEELKDISSGKELQRKMSFHVNQYNNEPKIHEIEMWQSSKIMDQYVTIVYKTAVVGRQLIPLLDIQSGGRESLRTIPKCRKQQLRGLRNFSGRCGFGGRALSGLLPGKFSVRWEGKS